MEFPGEDSLAFKHFYQKKPIYVLGIADSESLKEISSNFGEQKQLFMNQTLLAGD